MADAADGYGTTLPGSTPSLVTYSFQASSCLVKEGSVAGVNGLTTLEAGDET